MIWAGDPVGEDSPAPTMVVEDRVADKARLLHYSRIANMLGLSSLATNCLSRAGEPVREAKPRVDAESEVYSAAQNLVTIGGRKCIAIRMEFPISSPNVPTALRCGRYLLELGLDEGIARDLLKAEGPSYQHMDSNGTKGPLEGTLDDGVGVRITATSDGEALNPMDWWRFGRGSEAKR